jgi:hypothetical protein
MNSEKNISISCLSIWNRFLVSVEPYYRWFSSTGLPHSGVLLSDFDSCCIDNVHFPPLQTFIIISIYIGLATKLAFPNCKTMVRFQCNIHLVFSMATNGTRCLEGNSLTVFIIMA